MQEKKSKIILSLLLLVFSIIYGSVSFCNHYFFRTYSLDLGAYTKCLYDFMHGVINDSLVYRSEPVNCFASHFDLYLVLFAPLYIFGETYTLLIVQIVSVLLGSLGIYKLIGLYSDNKYISLCAAVTFLCYFGIYHALAYDYHSNVVASMLLPWFFYAFKKRRYGCSTFVMLMFVIAKENLSLLMAFICLGLLFDYKKDKKAVSVLLLYFVFSVFYFYIVTAVVMPALNDSENMRGFVRFKRWGNSFSEIIVSFLMHPQNIYTVLFNGQQKQEFWMCFLFSGGIFLFLKPNYLFMLIPVIAAKMLTDYSAMWGIFLHYNVEFAPIVIIAGFVVISKIKNEQYLLGIGLLEVVCTIFTLIYTTRFSHNWHNRKNTQIFSVKHYEQPRFDVNEAYLYMKKIPEDASVCASDIFVPHLCLRKNIYTYHDKKVYDTEWMLLLEPQKEVDLLLDKYNVENQSDELWLLKKK
ncbi:MAG: DUF2079 domain-containing protein [Bacteroidales bacterium]|nr:DUF2079 domain-containing protein [Bacteroidales bacterium]